MWLQLPSGDLINLAHVINLDVVITGDHAELRAYMTHGGHVVLFTGTEEEASAERQRIADLLRRNRQVL